MKFSFKSFVIGFGCAALSLGAVTYANAAGNATLKACANKTTGVMRYISKGSCKKTEKALSWNQMGPQGFAGTNGQNFHVIDAAGRDLGVSLGVTEGGSRATIFHEGGMWTVNSATNFPTGVLSASPFYSDSSCNIPLATGPTGSLNTTMSRGSNDYDPTRGYGNNQGTRVYWKAIGNSFLLSSKVVYGKENDFPCTASTEGSFRTRFRDWGDLYLAEVAEVTPPAYTAPFTIVAK